MIEPLDFITRLREIYPERYAAFSGGCLKFHVLLKAMYPQARGFYDSEHLVTLIDGVYYDIDGIVEDVTDYLPVEAFGKEHFKAIWESPRRFEVIP